jgi:hypothetical protein
MRADIPPKAGGNQVAIMHKISAKKRFLAFRPKATQITAR